MMLASFAAVIATSGERLIGLTLGWRWFTPLSIFLAIFCVGWDGFLVLWYSVALGEDAPLVMQRGSGQSRH